jgi:hypothetical protein
MANFDLNSYATVDERLALLYSEHPNARILTENLTTATDRAAKVWVVRAELWLIDDNGDEYIKATGHAFEIDGAGMANKTSALENCETSAVGRALALAGYSGNKKGLASRQEMEKVERAVAPIGRDWVAEAYLATSKDTLRALWAEARSHKATNAVLTKIQAVADGFTNSDSVGGSEGTE